ncbi:sulfotransferase [Photobacterium sp. 1_MG-2023]|uniref:sulfotransferase family protein n=1 Tax=Photobacterium sp. 1_MG-2023 TaxID=3062646 RepID=UPI0026E2331E|nr:sulfotransferase [Photobacterium sp. 1_MG-2023]MDO6707098.1 sulfotransferase [Photobacterium sp. 1_MG-2023]
MARLCFLLGIMPRSGTNYFANLLNLHPQCFHNAPVYEDFLLSQSGYLNTYCQQVKRHWSSRWDPQRHILTEAHLMRHLGLGLQQFLLSGPKQQALSETDLVVAKTPSVRELRYFFKLFPDSKLLILVRDGRAVAESGVRSFDWDFEKAAYDWGTSAQRILDFMAEHPERQHQIKRVSYESLLTDAEQTLKSVFEFLALDPDALSMDAVRQMHVSGSSEQREQQSAVTWTPMAADQNFQPLARFRHWRPHRHRRFEWLAGQALYDLGYLAHAPKFTLWEQILQRGMDLSWGIRVTPKTLHHAVVHRKLILKTY